LAVAAVLVGFAKTAVGGAGSLAIVLFAAVLPARESTGAILPLLIAGDLVAVGVYRRHCAWSTLLRLLPGVLPGLVLGAWFVAEVDDALMRRGIGAILLAMTAAQLWQRVGRGRRGPEAAASPPRQSATLTAGIGALVGFTTMTANAAGPLTTLYLVVAGLPMLEIIGTGAWLFLVVNVSKLPISAGLGLVTAESLLLDAFLVPAMLVGAALGVWLVRRIQQGSFEIAALGLAALASAALLV
jgi:uncharacterized membrane protein YfcA